MGIEQWSKIRRIARYIERSANISDQSCCSAFILIAIRLTDVFKDDHPMCSGHLNTPRSRAFRFRGSY